MSDETIATGYLRLIPSVDGIQGAIGGQFSAAGTAAGGLFGAGFATKVGGFLAVVGGAMLAREVKDFVQSGIDGLARIETINTQTQAAITSTGNAANVSAEGVHALALALEAKTASEAESIQTGANLLLTFKNIRNEAGAGNDIFDQTVKSMVDVGRAMGTDAAGAAIQLGKALNDPVKGIAALTRVGITFTDAQKDQIAALVEGNDLLGAQKIILGELNSQFGGSGAAYAETYAGKLYLVQDALGDVSQTVVTGLMPAFKDFLGVALDVLNRVNDSPTFKGILDKINAIGDEGVDRLGDVVDLIDRLSSTGDLNPDSILGGLGEIFPTLDPLLQLLEALAPALPQVKDGMLAIVDALTSEGVLDSLITLVTDVLPPLVDLLVAVTPLIPPLSEALSSQLPGALQKAQDGLSPLLWMLDLLETALQSDSVYEWADSIVASGNIVGQAALVMGKNLADFVNGIVDSLNAVGDGIETFVRGLSFALGGDATFTLPDIAHMSYATAITYTNGKSRSDLTNKTLAPGVPKMADGGTISRAGWAIVGEAGPELINMNVGAQVQPLNGGSSIGFPDTVTLVDSNGSILGHMDARIGAYDRATSQTVSRGVRGWE